ncbi:MAG: class I SAM-dependent methyltransferase [Eubacteriales bacterium]|nr:class I SAM-dependent methyltransferase [Eubacteriales bacterium]
MFWDFVAGIYDIFAKRYNSEVHENLGFYLMDRIEERDIVLECACGTGIFSRAIATKCNFLVATDISKNMLKVARRNCYDFSNIHFEKSDINQLRYKEESFDKVVAANVIHLLEEPYRALEELYRVCRTGGSIIIPTYISKGRKGKDNLFVRIIGKLGANFQKQFSYREYKAFFRKAGFSNIEYCIIWGRVPCAVAVIKKEETGAVNRYLHKNE